MYGAPRTVHISPTYTVNKRKTCFSLKALHIPYRFSLIRWTNRENHRFLTPILAGQIAGPPSQHEASDFWKSFDFLVVTPSHVYQSLSTSQQRCLLNTPCLYNTYPRVLDAPGERSAETEARKNRAGRVAGTSTGLRGVHSQGE